MKNKLKPDDPHGLTEDTLPTAIGSILNLNNYKVEYSIQVHGAEIDILATPKSNPYASKIYIEATIQYVDNTKYGKDATKFIMVQRNEPSAICLSVSLKGFTKDVKERANASGVRTETYSEFFANFEQFAPYSTAIMESKALNDLVGSYEPPLLMDTIGSDDAVSWFNSWLASEDSNKWIVLLGEYGTGKTALTSVLQHQWTSQYTKDASSRIPIRIELRNFTRQFDANSLLHHFLDRNSLSHIPIAYLRHLIASGRVILLLDGYDEMAQFMNARERRACLSALAELAADGAKGILTSRPNYFTEAEELSVFETLYATIDKAKYHTGPLDQSTIEEEKLVDNLLHQYVLSRKERHLRDLDATQTANLVSRRLSNDVAGRDLVLAILSKVFRSEEGGRAQSLSGKPVIVSFLLELIDELKSSESESTIYGEALTEYSVYKMIVDRLMLRDYRRSPTMSPDDRRHFLQKLAIQLSQRSSAEAEEQDFFRIIDDVFRHSLNRVTGEERRSLRDEYFQDLRSSSTLTRKERGKVSKDLWQFSHNSLREYLVTETIISSLLQGKPFPVKFPVSLAMRQFAQSMPTAIRKLAFEKLRSQWPNRDFSTAGTFASLLWMAILEIRSNPVDSISQVFGRNSNKQIDFSGIALDRIHLDCGIQETSEIAVDLNSSYVFSSSLVNLVLDRSTFVGSMLEEVSFKDCSLKGVDFSSSYIFECVFQNVDFNGADFRKLDHCSFFIREYAGGAIHYSDLPAIGYLKYHGAITDDVPDFYVASNHPKFSIVTKICENISAQKNSQLRGLTQRGAAQSDPIFARKFMEFMKSNGVISINPHDLVSVTDKGRGEITRLIDFNELFDGLFDFLQKN